MYPPANGHYRIRDTMRYLGISKTLDSIVNSFGTHRSHKLDHWFYSGTVILGKSMVQRAKLLDSIVA